MSDGDDKRIDEGWKEQARKEKEKLSAGEAGGGDGNAPASDGVSKPADGAQGEKPQAAPGGSPRRPSPREELPPASFMMLIMSLGSQAMMHLGLSPNPATGKPEVNLGQAKFTIDLLSMLEEKTAGNLDENEKAYLTSMLYDLRMRYVQAAR